MTREPSGGPPFYDVIMRQRACRSFLPDPIADDVIERILSAATHAPSAENSQPWRFVVVRDEAKRKAIVTTAAQVWEGGARQHSAPKLTKQLLADVDQATSGGGIAVAPVIVIVCGDPANTFPSAMESSIWPCVQNLLVAATAEGLGSALTTLATLVPGRLHELLDLPEDITPYAVVPLGRPARQMGPPNRRDLREVTHYDSWDGQRK